MIALTAWFWVEADQRFCSLPPIAAEELETVDLDQLIAQLSEAGPEGRFDAGA